LPLPDLAISERARPDVPIPVAASPPPRFNWQLAASARAGLWTMLAGLGVLMLLTALHDTNGP
jgi:hypothetical protein